MARFLSEVMTGKKSVPQPNDASITKVPVTIVLPAALSANDILSLVDLPPNVHLVDYDISGPQLDSNGSPTLVFSIGEENTAGTDLAATYETGLTVGRTASGSIARAGNAAAANSANNAAARRIALKVGTGAATYAGSGKTLLALLHLKH